MTIKISHNNRKQLKIYKEKEKKKKKEKVRRWEGCSLLVTIRIPYNNGIWRICANGETNSKVGNKVTPKFKEMLNKCQLVN